VQRDVRLIDLPDGYVNVAEHLIERGYHVDDRVVRRAWPMWATTSLAVVHNMKIPEGFVFDGASIPRVFRWLFSRVGAPHQVAALLHDWLYSEQFVSRRHADRMYYRTCLKMGVGGIPARLMFVALVLFGGMAWVKNGRRLKRFGSGWRSLDRVTEWI
jgi:hypothetical protein